MSPVVPRLLDLFCKAGGAAKGYHDAGFEVVGVDIEPQLNYPYEFHQADAMTYPLDGFDVIHASPPCQHYSIGTRTGRYGDPAKYPDLIALVRNHIHNKPFVIENVQGASSWMHSPLRLCGEMFGLNVVRHRLFESNLNLEAPAHKPHLRPVMYRTRQRKLVQRSAYCQVAGHGGDSTQFSLAAWSQAMGIDWMTKLELTQAIPPVYTHYIGQQILQLRSLQIESLEDEFL